jgi:hypothetical protein
MILKEEVATKALSYERKSELVQDLEAYINRYLDKQWVIGEQSIYWGWMDGPEKRFLQSLNYEFKVEY